ncbi:hypothetical protein ACFV5N_10665, partial [Streptomyces sp. NPDC059853]
MIRDRRLSFAALGLIVYLLSLPAMARASIRQLAGLRTEGRTRIGRMLHELEDGGYLKRVVRKTDEGLFYTEYELFDVPGGSCACGSNWDPRATGSLPSEEKTGLQEPPSLPPEPEPEPEPQPGVPAERAGAPAPSVPSAAPAPSASAERTARAEPPARPASPRPARAPRRAEPPGRAVVLRGAGQQQEGHGRRRCRRHGDGGHHPPDPPGAPGRAGGRPVRGQFVGVDEPRTGVERGAQPVLDGWVSA